MSASVKHRFPSPPFPPLLTMIATKPVSAVECIVLELRAGIGGHEANLFAEQLLKMYHHVALKNN